jgi:hypothetical protein
MIKKPCGRGGHNPRWAAEPEKIINTGYVTQMLIILEAQVLKNHRNKLFLLI